MFTSLQKDSKGRSLQQTFQGISLLGCSVIFPQAVTQSSEFHLVSAIFSKGGLKVVIRHLLFSTKPRNSFKQSANHARQRRRPKETRLSRKSIRRLVA